MQKTLKISAALAALTVLGGSAFAQTPPPSTPPAHHGFLSNLFHHNRPAPAGSMPGQMMPGHMMPGRPMMGGGMNSMMGGGVIGNKNTHVYHLPGDKGMLPAAQNRVYFHSAAQAEAAGYHRAGGGSTMSGRHMHMHGSPTMGTPMHHMMRPGGM